MLPLRDNVPTRSLPFVTLALILANCLVWIWELGGAGLEAHVVKYAYYPCAVADSCVAPATFREVSPLEGAFTSMFMHGSWEHILGNMLFLWIFGNNVEDAMGRLRYLAFYVLGGLAATALQTVVTLWIAGPTGESVPNIGASGAIAAVLGAYIVLLPRASVLTFVFFFVVPIPAIAFLGIWFVMQVYFGGLGVAHPTGGEGVAFFAHVGGFVFGFLFVRAFAVRRPLRPAW
jgi:membrane associated rhomboid family serine protease